MHHSSELLKTYSYLLWMGFNLPSSWYKVHVMWESCRRMPFQYTASECESCLLPPAHTDDTLALAKHKISRNQSLSDTEYLLLHAACEKVKESVNTSCTAGSLFSTCFLLCLSPDCIEHKPAEYAPRNLHKRLNNSWEWNKQQKNCAKIT